VNAKTPSPLAGRRPFLHSQKNDNSGILFNRIPIFL
jgi:hypothetical protein